MNERLLMNEHAAAKMLGMSVQTLRQWRHERRGPVFLKLGRTVRYRVGDIDAFVNGSVVKPIQ